MKKLEKLTAEQLRAVFKTKGSLNICIGSWKAYNEDNGHSLGSCYEGSFYINFDAVESGEHLKKILFSIGWTEAEMEELFVQDYESDYITINNCDYTNPLFIIEAITDKNINLSDEAEKIGAILEAYEDNIVDAINNLDNYDYYSGKTAEEYEEDFVSECYDLDRICDSWLNNYISVDYEAMARDDDSITETANGVLRHV